jgi:hypothetical protein
LPGGKLPTFLSEDDIRTSLLLPSQLGGNLDKAINCDSPDKTINGVSR